ncbi:hypothetical protein TNCV_190401 [Trichonephila clavipes]|nr:hypothetical protein TNCV_190401 [Trichonephila clavipes]
MEALLIFDGDAVFDELMNNGFGRSVSTFHDPGYLATALISPVPTFSSSVLARSFSLYRLSFDLLPGADSGYLHAPPKSKICPLWLILPFQTPGTENSQTVKQKIHKPNTQ